MTQLLEEWRELEDEEQPELEQLIISQSTENHLLTPFVTLQVSKPTLREAMTSPAVSPMTALAEAEAVTYEEAEDALAAPSQNMDSESDEVQRPRKWPRLRSLPR